MNMNEPKLRFKADDGSQFPDWEEKKLNEIAVRVTRKNKDNVTDIPLTISSVDGLIDQRDFFNKVVASKDMSGYYLLKNGEFAYNKSYSKGYDFGSIKRLDLYDEGALSTLYICFALNKNENSDFYQKYFDSLSWYPELQKICAEGARNHGLLNVPTNDFFQLKLCVPSSEQEQQKIAEFLSTIDTVIAKQKETVSAWEERKKGVMQKLFSQEVRFKADDGSDYSDWEEKKLGDVFTERTERSKGGESLLSVTIAQGIIKQSETDKRNIASENKSNYKIVKKNDLAYNTMRMWQGAEGVSEYDGIVSPAYTVITAVDGNNSYFFETMFKQTFMLQVFQRFSQGLTSDTWNLKFPAFSEIKCLIPCEDEQNKIVECVAVLDEVIEKQKATLAAWEELKKGLSQQMFV